MSDHLKPELPPLPEPGHPGRSTYTIMQMRDYALAAVAEDRTIRIALPPQDDADSAIGRDWPEDFTHENGNYQCACIHCGQFFCGHKRRVVCKQCAERTKPVLSEAECKNLVFYMGSDQMALVRAVEVSVLVKVKEPSCKP